ncbi:MAG: hypothetical protein KF744_01535 [Taibaiella sp.]|nr:hypothetical protein [Taibaiella sp.]
MAISINHRFIERLTSTANYDKVNIVIIGTFNPGLPDFSKLDRDEKARFALIENSRKFKKFNQVKNFYDRPQNRFWKIMDFINDNHFYSQTGINTINYNGLKFYVGMDREKVFKKQQEFCYKNKVLITDIVKAINPLTFNSIYDNFPDTAIENAFPVWNTEEIIEVIKKYKPAKVLINFSADSKTTPNICAQVSRIKKSFPDIIVPSLKSTSGAAGFRYDVLIEDWKEHFVWKKATVKK